MNKFLFQHAAQLALMRVTVHNVQLEEREQGVGVHDSSTMFSSWEYSTLSIDPRIPSHSSHQRTSASAGWVLSASISSLTVMPHPLPCGTHTGSRLLRNACKGFLPCVQVQAG